MKDKSVEERKRVIAEHEKWFMSDDCKELRGELHELKDKILGCWCAPQACHCDLYVKLCRGLTSEKKD